MKPREGKREVAGRDISYRSDMSGTYGEIPSVDVHTRRFPLYVPDVFDEHFNRDESLEVERDGDRLRVSERLEGVNHPLYLFDTEGETAKFWAREGLDQQWKRRVETLLERTAEVYRAAWKAAETSERQDLEELLEKPSGASRRLSGPVSRSLTGGGVPEREEAYAKLYLDTLSELKGPETGAETSQQGGIT